MARTLLDMCESIDFALLRKQKAFLLTLAEDLSGEEEQAVTGIIHLLDDLQDDAHKLGFPAFSESKNENCIVGLKCPKCGHEDSFDIVATSLMRVLDDGTDTFHDVEWGGRSNIMCAKCHHTGKVWEFQA